MAKLNTSALGYGKNAKSASNRNTRIVRGKGATAPNPQPRLEGMEKSGGLKGPYHG